MGSKTSLSPNILSPYLPSSFLLFSTWFLSSLPFQPSFFAREGWAGLKSTIHGISGSDKTFKSRNTILGSSFKMFLPREGKTFLAVLRNKYALWYSKPKKFILSWSIYLYMWQDNSSFFVFLFFNQKEGLVLFFKGRQVVNIAYSKTGTSYVLGR